MPNAALDLDTRLLADFLCALNIARRQILSYPPGHPMIASASAKLLALVSNLLEFRAEITIGIARNVLLVGTQPMDAGNPIYRDLATSLFDARVASLTIHRDVTDSEIRNFFEILRYRRDAIADAGGLARLLAEAGIRGITAQGIDFGAFHATEVDAVNAPRLAVPSGEGTVLWRTFVAGLTDGTLDARGKKILPAGHFDPTVLADMLNGQYAAMPEKSGDSYDQAITSFLRQADRRDLSLKTRQESYEQLGQLIERLSPELRRRFLNSTLRKVAAEAGEAEELLVDWPRTALIEALAEVDAGRLQVPQTLLHILGRLAGSQPGEGRGGRVVGEQARSREETAQLVELLFREGDGNRFVPADYRDALAVLAVADVASDLDRAQVEELQATLNGHAVEQQFCAVLLDLVDRDIGPRTADAVTRNLEELVDYFLESGDFSALSSVHDYLTLHFQQTQPRYRSPDSSALRCFHSDGFVSQLLDGFDQWEKEQQPALCALIGQVGAPCAAPLLDRLAEETVMARRRLYLECLQKIGPPALPAIVERLEDPRWYVVRNLVMLMREIGDPASLPALSRLAGHHHPKVQTEVVRTLLQFQDERAEQSVLKELDSSDLAAVLNAVRLAAGCRNVAIACRLAELLNDLGNTEPELSLKSMIIKILAEMACGEVLGELGAFIESRGLFVPAAVSRVKVEAIMTLPRYADPEAQAIVERVRRKGSAELARAAQVAAISLKGRSS